MPPSLEPQQRAQVQAQAVFKKALKSKETVAPGKSRSRRSQIDRGAAYQQKLEQREAQQALPITDTPTDGNRYLTPYGRAVSDIMTTPNSVLVDARSPTGLTSLDMRLPSPDPARWERYRFAAPRSDARLSAWAISGGAWQALEHLVIVAVLLGLFFAVRGVSWGGSLRRLDPRSLSSLIVAAGVLGALVGVLPLFAAAMAVGGAVWKRVLTRAGAQG